MHTFRDSKKFGPFSTGFIRCKMDQEKADGINFRTGIQRKGR